MYRIGQPQPPDAALLAGCPVFPGVYRHEAHLVADHHRHPVADRRLLCHSSGQPCRRPAEDRQRASRRRRIEAALEAANTASPNTLTTLGPGRVRVAALVLARQMLIEENFAIAERALNAVVKVLPEDAEAKRLIAGSSRTRSRPPAGGGSRRWLDLEWYEPAFNTCARE